MEFCNEGMVQADPSPPVMVKDHIFTFFYPSLIGFWYHSYNKRVQEEPLLEFSLIIPKLLVFYLNYYM